MGSGTETGLSINQKIVLWTKGRLGKKVGRGQCWDLAEQALKQAGAQTSNDLGPVGENTDYIWGEKIKSKKDIMRGDILQIRDHLIKRVAVIEYKFADGSTVTETQERTYTRGHHTAIVRSKPTVDGTIKIYEQHVNRRDVVQKGILNILSIAPQKTSSFAKRKHPRTKRCEQSVVTTTITIEVSGMIWAYRPKPKP